MKKKYLLGLFIVPFTMVACGGGEEEGTDEASGTDSTAQTEDVIEAITYSVDTEASTFAWWNSEGGEKSHTGTFSAAGGSFTVEGDVITDASMTVEMSSVAEDGGNENFMGHLASADLLNFEINPTATFSFDRHEEGMIYGTVNAAGLDMPVEAGATVADGTVTLTDFTLDMSALMFFQTELAETPEEERHDPNIGFNGTVVGVQQ